MTNRVPTDEEVRAASMIAYPKIMEALLDERAMVRALLETYEDDQDGVEFHDARHALVERSKQW